MHQSSAILHFFSHLAATNAFQNLPSGLEVMNPYQDADTLAVCRQFYEKFYADSEPRTLLLGINPGRLGAGVTGISFTDPVRLETECGIPNHFPKKKELSSEFIYQMIAAYGGVHPFYSRFFISALSPLGFLKDGKNINYYDDARLQEMATPFMAESMGYLLKLPLDRQRVFCIGEGRNAKFLTQLNDQYGWFEQVIPLPHPRFIMQYRRKKSAAYVELYVRQLKSLPR